MQQGSDSFDLVRIKVHQGVLGWAAFRKVVMPLVAWNHTCLRWKFQFGYSLGTGIRHFYWRCIL